MLKNYKLWTASILISVLACSQDEAPPEDLVKGTKDVVDRTDDGAADVPIDETADSEGIDAADTEPETVDAEDAETGVPPDNACPVASVVSPVDGEPVLGQMSVSLTVVDATGVDRVTVKDSGTSQVLLDFPVSGGPTEVQLSGTVDVCRYGTGEVIFALNLLDSLGNGCNRQLKPHVIRCPRFFGGAPIDVAATDATVVDFDGDGDLDVLAASGDQGVHLLRGQGELRPGAPQLLLVDHTRFVVADDLTADGDADLVAVGEQVVRVSTQGPGGALEAADELPLPAPVTAVAYADVARDPSPEGGAQDLEDLVIGLADGRVGIAVREEGTAVAPFFGEPQWVAGEGSVTDLVLGDWFVEEGGHVDVLAMAGTSLRALKGDGEGGLAPPAETTLPTGGTGLLADGGDAWISLGAFGQVWRLPGEADGTFDLLNKEILCVEGFPRALGRVGGKLAVANAAEQSLWLRTTSGWQIVGAVAGPDRILGADLDGDEVEDAVLVDQGHVLAIGGDDGGLLRGQLRVTAPIPETFEGGCAERRRVDRAAVGDLDGQPGAEVALLSVPDGPLRSLDALTLPNAALFDQHEAESLLNVAGAVLAMVAVSEQLVLSTSIHLQRLTADASLTFQSVWTGPDSEFGFAPATLVTPMVCADDSEVAVAVSTELGPGGGPRLVVVGTGAAPHPVPDLPPALSLAAFGAPSALYVGHADAVTIVSPLAGCAFGQTVTVDPGATIQEAAAGDVDGDGVADLVALTEDGAVRVLTGVDGVVFEHAAEAVPETAGPASGPLVVGDLNGDGWPDVLAAGDGVLRGLINRGDGTFWGEWTPIEAAPGVTQVWVLDVDGDGCTDVASLSPAANAVEVPWEKRVGYCRAVRAGDLVFVTGCAPVGEDGDTVGVSDGYAQARRCLEIVRRALEDVGATIEDVVRTRMFVTDISRWAEYGRAHAEVFADHPPATTMVEVQALIAPDMLIEIEADAVV